MSFANMIPLNTRRFTHVPKKYEIHYRQNRSRYIKCVLDHKSWNLYFEFCLKVTITKHMRSYNFVSTCSLSTYFHKIDSFKKTVAYCKKSAYEELNAPFLSATNWSILTTGIHDLRQQAWPSDRRSPHLTYPGVHDDKSNIPLPPPYLALQEQPEKKANLCWIVTACSEYWSSNLELIWKCNAGVFLGYTVFVPLSFKNNET